MRAQRLFPQQAGVSVALARSPRPWSLPEACACCGAASTHRLALQRQDGVSLLVGYCDECAEHQASHSARALGLGLASLLLALVAAAGLPLVWPWLGLSGLVLSVLSLSALPALALLLPTADANAPHSAVGPAVSWGPSDQLLCASPSYGAQVSERNSGELEPRVIHESRASAWLLFGPVLGLAASGVSFFVYHPILRILNLGPARVEVAIDGRKLASVDATSNESPAAGALVRVPAGPHTLSVRSSINGAELERVAVHVQSGAVHLFAISVVDTCFWLETTGYGREQRTTSRSYERLHAAQPFWILPSGIDSWFAPNPDPSELNSRSSGGLLTALRQAPCQEAPAEVRSSP